MTNLFATDLNGTLVDSKLGHREALNETLRQMGKRERASLRYIEKVMGRPLADYYKTLFPNAEEEEINQFLSIMIESFSVHVPRHEKLIPYSVEVLTELKRRGYNLVVISTMPSRGISSTLRRHGIIELFDSMLGIEETRQRGGYDVGEEKGRLLRSYTERVDADRVFMIGDTEYDINAGVLAGAMTFYFNPNGRKNNRATYSIRNWKEVLSSRIV